METTQTMTDLTSWTDGLTTEEQEQVIAAFARFTDADFANLPPTAIRDWFLAQAAHVVAWR